MADRDNEMVAYYDPGTELTAYTEAAVIGCRFVSISDPKKVASEALSSSSNGGNIVVSQTGAGAHAIGVANYDMGIDKKVPITRGHKVVKMTAGAGMTAGQKVMSDGSGRPIAWVSAASEANNCLGTVLNTPTGIGEVAIVALNI